MATFGFWNVDLLHNVEGDTREIAQHAADFTVEYSLDILCLIECITPADTLASTVSSGETYYPISSGRRFKVIARFDPIYMERLSPPVPNERFDIWHLHLPLQESVIVGAVHGLDKRNNSISKQELFLQQFLAALTYFEGKLGHDRTLVFGDLNSNPFESPVASAICMNAVSSGAIALGKPRKMLGQTYPFFYNPMWNLYGDLRGGAAPGTYFYHGSDPHELYWHMLDQVLLRPSLMDRLNINSLDIVTSIGGKQLLSSKGVPDRRRFSDHLPVIFEVDLTTQYKYGSVG